MVEAVADADGGDDLVQPFGVGAAAGEGKGQVHVLDRRQCGKQVERLEHEADSVATQQGEVPFGEAAEFRVADEGRSGGQVVEAGGAVHQG